MRDARDAGLAGSFRALLPSDGASAASRFHPGGARPYVRVDGVVVTSLDGDLFLGQPEMLAPIDVDADGRVSGGPVFSGSVTGTLGVGNLACAGGENAARPATAALVARYGAASLTGTDFFGGFEAECSRAAAIYCLQD
jgi:hypothetical protein